MSAVDDFLIYGIQALQHRWEKVSGPQMDYIEK